MIKIKTRDINGVRAEHYFYTDEDVYRFAMSEDVQSENIEILSVCEDGACLYSALGNDQPLTADDLSGFFG